MSTSLQLKKKKELKHNYFNVIMANYQDKDLKN